MVVVFAGLGLASGARSIAAAPGASEARFGNHSVEDDQVWGCMWEGHKHPVVLLGDQAADDSYLEDPEAADSILAGREAVDSFPEDLAVEDSFLVALGRDKFLEGQGTLDNFPDVKVHNRRWAGQDTRSKNVADYRDDCLSIQGAVHLWASGQIGRLHSEKAGAGIALDHREVDRDREHNSRDWDKTVTRPGGYLATFLCDLLTESG